MHRLWVLALLLIATAATAATAQPHSNGDGDFRNLDPDRIADQLLPVGHPTIVRADFVEPPGATAINRVHLFARRVVAAEDFCRQQILSLWMTPIPRDPATRTAAPPRRVSDVEDVATYRHNAAGQSCDDGQAYFHIYATNAETAFADVRRLAALIDQVRAHPDAPLAFAADCRDEFEYVRPCSAAAMLAELTTGDIGLVATRQGRELRLGLPLEQAARTGRGRLVEISLRRGVVHYTVHMLVRDDRITGLHISGGIPIP